MLEIFLPKSTEILRTETIAILDDEIADWEKQLEYV